ncbi:MAG TPA: TlpA disulfide reductase family protein [Saprospiraceae bacterium]|nr:TlpA disulfide reductase family protein [Saprospiraceae bacterium]HMP25477.1 TlpA disulfide reductase family protein [Saprospiraceae bacterium]
MRAFFRIRKLNVFIVLMLLLSSSLSAEVPLIWNRANNKIKITGKIETGGTDIFIIYSTKNQNAEISHQNGFFELELALEEPEIISLAFSSNQRIELFVRPGDAINITFDKHDFPGSLLIFGDRERENIMLAELTRIMEVTPFVNIELFGMEESAFIEKTEAMLAETEAALKKYAAHYGDDDILFTRYVGNYINYTLAHYRQVYPQRYRRSTGDKYYTPSERLNSLTEKIIIEEADLLNIPAYRNYLFSITEENALDLLTRDSALSSEVYSFFLARYQCIEKDFSNATIKDYLKYKVLRGHISTNGANGIEEFYQSFLNESVNEMYKNNLVNIIKELEPLTIDAPTPDFTYPDIDSFLHSLSAYKGKYIYIDVWATWCAPCLAELPHFEKLMDSYADHPEIIFMGVSIDENSSAWRKMVINKKMRGVQLLAEGGWNSKISMDYRIKGIPRYILIDKNGGILYLNAPRPSSEAAKKLLKGLLEME